MPIFRALGLGILIITLRLMLPNVLDAGQDTIIAFLNGARVSADTASSIAASATLAGTTPSSPLPPLVYPQAPTIPLY